MTCTRLSDRMIQVQCGRETWSHDEREHLAACDDCRIEWQILTRVAVIAAPSGFDSARVAAEVTRRLAEPVNPGTPSLGRQVLPFVGIAAAAALALILLPEPKEPARPQTAAASSAWIMTVPGLDNLSEPQLRMVLESIDEPVETPGQALVPSMLDLEEQQLEQILRSLEG